MSILQRYIFFRYISFLSGTMLLFIALFVMIKFTEQINLFIEISDRTPFIDYINFFLYEIPFTVTYLFPMASLFALVYVLGKLNEENELIIFYTAGKSALYYVIPIFIFNLFVSFFMLTYEDKYFYKTHQEHMSLFRRFQNREFFKQEDRNNLVQFGKDNKIYLANHYSVRDKVLSEVNLIYLNPDNSFKEVLSTSKVSFITNTEWKLEDSFIHFINQGDIGYLSRRGQDLDLGDVPNNFIANNLHPKDLSAKQSREIAEKLEIIGGNYNRWWTEYHRKISFFFINIVMFFIGVSLSTFSKNSVLILSFSYVIFLTFIYLILNNMGASLGQIRVLPPVVAGWFGNIVFTIVAFFIYRRIRV